jgi:asparagine synthase (glutamine-hydrolysing)
LSGIVGIFRRRGVPVQRDILKSLTNFLRYRGPDALEVWTDGGAIGLGHAMLRTTREAAVECQPATLEARLWIVADARIDCREELVGELRRLGRGIEPAACDPELLLHAYDAWGEACVRRLRGDFSFAIWDAPRKKLFCARDHFGVKPFFYALTEDLFLFGNSLNCLRLHPEISDELNDAAIGDFLLFGLNCDPATTTFRDIQRLPPAHFLSLSAIEMRTERYWSPPVDGRIRYRRSEEYVEHFDALMKAAVGDRLRTESVGILLSGGLDSGFIAAEARELSAGDSGVKDLRAYTKVFETLLFDDEGLYARKTADFLKIPLELISVDDLQPFDRWEISPPEPTDVPFFAGLMDHYSLISSNCRVALAGDGADNLMSFQMWPWAKELLRAREWHAFAIEMAQFLWVRPVPWRGLRYRLERIAGQQRTLTEFPSFIAPDFAKRQNLEERWAKGYRCATDAHPVRPRAYESIMSPLLTQLCELNDPGVTRCPLEFRYPFFDLRIVEFLLSIPAFPWCFQKRIVREALRGRMPDAVRLRPKAPFRGDSYVDILQRKDSQWSGRVKTADQIERYVKRSSIGEFARERDGDLARIRVRPYCLNFWLQLPRWQYNLQAG